MRKRAVILALGLLLIVGCVDRPAPNTFAMRFGVTNDSPVAASLKIVNWASGAVVGNVTPPLIAPGARVQVVAEVPINMTGWGLYVDAGNGQGAVVFDGSDVLACTGDVPIEVDVSRAGQPSWQMLEGDWCP